MHKSSPNPRHLADDREAIIRDCAKSQSYPMLRRAARMSNSKFPFEL